MIVCLMYIYNKNCFRVKIETYHLSVGVIMRYKSRYHFLYKIVKINVIRLKKLAIKELLIMCVDKNLQKCHFIIISISVKYKEQLVIISIKSGIPWLIL